MATAVVKQVMTPSIAAVESGDPISKAARTMRDKDVGMLPVIHDNKIVGVVTDRDIVTRCDAAEKDPSKTTVEEAYTPGATWCRDNDSVEDAARIMRERQIRRLIVVDDETQPAGVLSIGDIATRTRAEEPAAETLTAVSSDLQKPATSASESA